MYKKSESDKRGEEFFQTGVLVGCLLLAITFFTLIPIILFYKRQTGFEENSDQEKLNQVLFYLEMFKHYKKWRICKICDLSHDEPTKFCYNCGRLLKT